MNAMQPIRKEVKEEVGAVVDVAGVVEAMVAEADEVDVWDHVEWVHAIKDEIILARNRKKSTRGTIQSPRTRSKSSKMVIEMKCRNH